MSITTTDSFLLKGFAMLGFIIGLGFLLLTGVLQPLLDVLFGAFGGLLGTGG